MKKQKNEAAPDGAVEKLDLLALADKELTQLQERVLAEVTQRAAARLRQARFDAVAFLNDNREQLEAVLELMTHSYSGCSDNNPCNAFTGEDEVECTKCALLYLLQEARYSEFCDYEVSVSVTLTRID